MYGPTRNGGRNVGVTKPKIFFQISNEKGLSSVFIFLCVKPTAIFFYFFFWGGGARKAWIKAKCLICIVYAL